MIPRSTQSEPTSVHHLQRDAGENVDDFLIDEALDEFLDRELLALRESLADFRNR